MGIQTVPWQATCGRLHIAHVPAATKDWGNLGAYFEWGDPLDSRTGV